MSLHPRFVREKVLEALTDTRVVLLAGPRQAGKTTLIKQVADQSSPHPGTYSFYSLDNITVRDTALRDPVGFIREIDYAVIDEVQRAPDLLLAIKERVDTDLRPGQFLLTGSANLMTLPRVADSLAGRMETISLLPLAQCEIRHEPSAFLAHAFADGVPYQRSMPNDTAVGDALVATVLAGGYPEALTRHTAHRRAAWYNNYVKSIIDRDVRDIASIEQLGQMPLLVRALAQYSGQLINYSALGKLLGLTHTTTRKYATVFAQLFMLRLLPAWHGNTLRRLSKTPKLHFLDSGLLASLRGLTANQLQTNRAQFGPLLESFVVAELYKLASWSDHRIELYHFRDQDGDEVDIVLEDAQGRVVGIEVKAAATVTNSDFKGLRKLAEACGDRFVCGMVLYDHTMAVSFGNRLGAVPISTLWE